MIVILHYVRKFDILGFLRLKEKFVEKFKQEFVDMLKLAEKDRLKAIRSWDVDYYNYQNAKRKFK